MIDGTTIVAVLAWALIAWLGVWHWRQIQAVRDWARANGLPLAPPKSQMRLARALEALQPTMSGLWDGLWVEVWTRPMWAVSTKSGIFSTTRDKVIRRELKIAEQEPFSATKLRKSRDALQRLGFFSDVNVTTRKSNTALLVAELEFHRPQRGLVAHPPNRRRRLEQ